MLYNAMQIADYIIDWCYKKGKPISNLHLQKVLYFTWVDYYKQTKKTLFWEPICAWQFGPVVPEVYYEFCAYGGRPINIKCETEILEGDKNILEKIIKEYVDIPVNILVDRTHQKGTAWDMVYQDGIGNRNVIPFQMIKSVECGG